MKQGRLWLAILVMIACQCFHFWALGRVPAIPTDDDGAYAAAGYQIWQTGRPGVAGYREVVGMGRDIYLLGHIGAAVQGIGMALFGVSVRQALLPSAVVGIGLLGMVFLLGRRLWGVRTGLTAALLLGFSGIYFSCVHGARPDMLVTLFLVCALWLVAGDDDRPGVRMVTAGLVMGLSGDVHPNGFLLAPVPLLFWLVWHRPGWRLATRAVLLYGAGGAIGIIWWLVRHYLPDPVGFQRQNRLHGLQTHGVRLLDYGAGGAVMAELQRYLDWFWAARGHRHLYEGICVVVAGVVLLWRGEWRDRALVVGWCGLFLIGAALMSNRFGYYLIFAWPFFALWLARAIGLAAERWGSTGQRVALAMAGLLLVAYAVNLGLWFWKAHREPSLTASIAKIRELVPEGASVFASAGLWFALWDRDFTHEPYIPFRRLEVQFYPETGPTGWEIEQQRVGWRYVVAYGNLRRFLDPDFPLEEILTIEPWSSRQGEVREARRYSLENLKVIGRIDSPGEPIVILERRVNR